jgi:hypothetical protein
LKRIWECGFMVQLSEPDWEYDRIHSWSLIRDWYVDMILQRGSHLMRSIGGSKRVVVAPCCNSTSYWINISSQWLLVEFRWISLERILSTVQSNTWWNTSQSMDISFTSTWIISSYESWSTTEAYRQSNSDDSLLLSVRLGITMWIQ